MPEETAEAKYAIGIDLGTSNCAVACADLASGKVRDFPVLQLERPGQRAPAPLLPSVLYAPIAEERAAGGLDLPWTNDSGWVAGRFARWRGARVPGRFVASAKSWLCHRAVDRTAPILPWGGAADVAKISPVQASALLLQHIREAWEAAHPPQKIARQEVVITVPASFDEAARELTVSAAREAGFEHFTLLEEPQAAFYQFSRRHEKELAQLLEEIRLVLVVDVGGGTTDFALVQVAPGGDAPLLKRIAVGDHLILGGDNMDVALARRVEERLAGRKLSPAQWIQLVQAAREAKEVLLGENAPANFKIALASEGSKLLGGTLSATLDRQEVQELLLAGFLPETRDFPSRAQRTGIQELGLPYVADPAITRHLAAFLHKHAAAGFAALGLERGADLPRPDAILLNGGVFNSRPIAQRLAAILSSWWPERSPVRLLAHDDLDLAVARGAAQYGLVRRGHGRKISGGSAHSFYLGIAPEKDEASPSAVCLIPRGLEEGESVELKERIFKLHVGKPVQFPLFTSTADRVDRPGDLVPIQEDFDALPPLRTVLKSAKARFERIPVYIRARLTELGTIELWCASADGPDRWRLEFDARAASGADAPPLAQIETLPARIGEAKSYIGSVYGKTGSLPDGPKDARQLWAFLERALGPRQSWTLPALRDLWGELLPGAAKRRRTPEHEKVFLQLLGFSLRPGFGYALDEWRCQQSAILFGELVEFHKEKPIWNEFWILWRRIAAGLSAENQGLIWEFLKPHLAMRVPAKPSKNLPRPKGKAPEGTDEMARAAAALEQAPAAEKEWLGGLICARLQELRPAGGPWAWALGRLGARVPLHGSVHNVPPPAVAERWIEQLLAMPSLDGAPFALMQLARRTGDRTRDIGENAREQVLKRLAEANASPAWIGMVSDLAEMKTADEARAFGEALPIGLQLARATPSSLA